MRKNLLFMVASLLLIIAANSGRGQVVITNYTFSCGSTTYTPISGTGGPTLDDQTITVSLPFTFRYIGVDYTQVSLCSNGWVAAGVTTSTTYVNTLCTTTSTDLKKMCPFWEDLYPPGGGNIQYTTIGSAPNRIWVAQWTNVNYFSGTGNVTMQIRLYEGSGLIEYIYGPCSVNAAASGSIGMNDATGGPSHVISVTPGSTCQNTTFSYVSCNDNVSFTNLTPNLRYFLSPEPQPRYFNTTWCPPNNPYPNIPAATIYNACAWIGDTLYMHTPSNTGAAATTVVRYSLNGNAWTTGVPLPVARTQGTLTSTGGKLYYIGGGTAPGTGETNTIYEYTPSTGTWVLKAPLPANVSGHGAAAWGDSVIFVIMGPWGTPTTSCYYFRIGSNTTGTTTSFPGLATKGHACAIWQDKIYVAGGQGASAMTKQFYIGTIGSSASTISWAAGPPFPSVPKAYLGGAAAGDRFYIVGGNNSIGSTSSDSTFVWGISGAVWTPLGSLKPVAAHNIEAAVTYRLVGDTVKIFCPGGSSGTGTTMNFDVIACGLTVTGIGKESEIPKEYALMQNYPNPFNPSTTISYALPTAGNVNLVVYNLLGKEVALLVNDYKHAGRYTVDFSAANLASGVYFYRIQSGQFTDVKKMLLLK
jgi:type IX secretion system substrate protein/Kelch motif protein